MGEIEARVERPKDDAPRQILRELGTTRLLVDALVVEEPSRRHDIGTALMRAAEDWARSKGATFRLSQHLRPQPKRGAVLRAWRWISTGLDRFRQATMNRRLSFGSEGYQPRRPANTATHSSAVRSTGRASNETPARRNAFLSVFVGATPRRALGSGSPARRKARSSRRRYA